MEQRIIKFKAKRLGTGEWMEGDLLHHNNRCYIGIHNVGRNIVANVPIGVDPSTVCQFTGIYDKDNKEIFENDLIQDIQTKEVFVVVWNAVYACYSFLDEKRNNIAAKNFADYPSKSFLIVGNRFYRKEEK